jgi:imidazolonepropionase-like amidohydrolase
MLPPLSLGRNAMRHRSAPLLVIALILLAGACAPAATPGAPDAEWDRAADSIAALEHFRSNVATIHRRDRPAYLQHYLQTPRLVRAGPAGVQYGYEGLAAGDPDSWPDTLVATHFGVTPVAPGVVYGAYRYRVVQGGASQRGVSERVMRRQPDGSWTITVTTAFRSPEDRPVPPYALVGATVIDGTGGAPMEGATVVMRGGRIDCVGECEVGDGVHAIDAAGHWIIPGLVDAHVHYSQTGWADGRPDATDVRDRFPYHAVVADLEQNPERFHRSYLCSGVTSVFDVGGFPWTQRLRERTAEATDAPAVAASGPLLSTRDHWLNLPDARQFVHTTDEEATRAGARAIVARGTDAIKVWYLVSGTAPDTAHWQAQLRTAAREATAAGVPLIVHATNLWAAKDALRAGARLLVHSVEDRPVDREFLELLRTAGASYTPTLTVREGYVQLLSRRFDEERVPLDCVDPQTREKARLTRTLTPAELDTAAYRERAEAGYRVMLENLRRIHEAGLPIATGTDAGNPLTLHGPAIHREMKAMAEAGLTPMEILVATTRNGARAMGLHNAGTLEPGMRADLVVLGADPLADIRNVRQVRLVVRNGEVWTREELEYD